MRREIIRLTYVFSLALLAAGCGPPKTSDQNLEMVSYERLDAMLNDTGRPTLLLDIRPVRYYAEAHLPGAVNIPLPDIVKQDPRLGAAHNIVVYGSHWLDTLAPAGAKKLIALGYQNVFLFRGGVEQWQSQGRAVERSEPAATN